MLSILCVRLTIKVKVGIPESFKVGWYPPKKTGSSHLKSTKMFFEAGNGLIPLRLFAIAQYLSVSTSFRAFTPASLQILRIDREGMIDDVISHGI